MAWRPQRALSILESTDDRGRIVPMEGLRGIGAALVFLAHYCVTFKVWADAYGIREAAPWLFVVGHYGVDMFFVLSGYLIYGIIIRKPMGYFEFARRRVRRIYPVFGVMVAIYLALSQVFPSESKLPKDTAEAVAYVCANFLMLPGMLPIRPMIVVAWSLSYEIFFYLSMPLAVAWLRMRSWRTSLRALTMASTGAAWIVASRYLGLPMHSLLTLFAAGMAAYELQVLLSRKPLPRAVHLAAAAMVIAVLPIGLRIEGSAQLGDWAPYLRTGWTAMVLGLIALSAFSGQGPLVAVFSWRPIRWLGNMSYSYYLIHGLVLKALGLVVLGLGITGRGFLFFWAAPIVFAITLVVAFALYAAVEYPLSVAKRVQLAPVPVPAVRSRRRL